METAAMVRYTKHLPDFTDGFVFMCAAVDFHMCLLCVGNKKKTLPGLYVTSGLV